MGRRRKRPSEAAGRHHRIAWNRTWPIAARRSANSASYLPMRSNAFRDADLIIVLGTRMNYVIAHAAPPRFNKDATIARIEIDPEELGTSARNVDIPIVGDCKSVLQQLIDAIDGKTADRFQPWRQKLAEGEAAKRQGPGGNYPTDGDIHPLRLCEEVKNFMNRDAILVVDGQEILNFGRQSIPTFTPGHRLNSGPFGTMGVGLPFAVGAKAPSVTRRSSACTATAWSRWSTSRPTTAPAPRRSASRTT